MVMKDNIAYRYSGIVNIRAKELYPKWNGSSNLVKYFLEPTNLLHWRRPCVCTDRDGRLQVYLEIGKPYSEAVLSCRRITNFEERFVHFSRKSSYSIPYLNFTELIQSQGDIEVQ